MTSSQHKETKGPPKDKDLSTEPFYTLKKEVGDLLKDNPKLFTNIVIDKQSLKLLANGKNDERYAIVGWIVEDKLVLHFKIGLESYYYLDESERIKREKELDLLKSKDEKEYQTKLIEFKAWDQKQQEIQEKLKAIKTKFGENNVVIAKREQPGIVHEQVVDLVVKEHPELGNLALNKIGFSVIKKDGALIWLNRSAQNTPTFIANPLAVACFAYNKKEMKVINRFYDLQRSIPAKIFEEITSSATQIILGKNYEAKYCQLDTCHNILPEDLWKYFQGVEKEKRMAFIQNELMHNLFFGITSGKEYQRFPEAMRALKLGLEAAPAAGISLNYIPKDYTKTAIMLAAEMQQEDFFNFLLKLTQTDIKSFLFDAVKQNEQKAAEFILQNKANLINFDEHGDALLSMAVNNGNDELAQLILKNILEQVPSKAESIRKELRFLHDIKVVDNFRVEEYMRPLEAKSAINDHQKMILQLGFQIAAKGDHLYQLDYLKKLPKAKLDPNQTYKLLEIAVNANEIENIKILLDAGANPFLNNGELYRRVQSKPEIRKLFDDKREMLMRGPFLKLFLAPTQLTDEKTITSFLQTKTLKELEIVFKTVRVKTPPDSLEVNQENFLNIIKTFGNLEQQQWAGIRLNCTLHNAAQKGYVRVVDYLMNELDERVDAIDWNGNLPITYAAASGQLEMVKLLLEKKSPANVENPEKNTPLIFAANKGHLEVAKLLLNTPDFPNAQMSLDFIRELESNNVEAVRQFCLSEKKSDFIKQATALIRSACVQAVNTNNTQMMAMLLSLPEKEIVLEEAIMRNNVEALKYIFQSGMNIEFYNKYNQTPLFLAVLVENAAAVKLLLDLGANPFMPSEQPNPTTPQVFANRYPAMKQIFEDYAAAIRIKFYDKLPVTSTGLFSPDSWKERLQKLSPENLESILKKLYPESKEFSKEKMQFLYIVQLDGTETQKAWAQMNSEMSKPGLEKGL